MSQTPYAAPAEPPRTHLSETERAIRAAVLGAILGVLLRLVARR